MKNKVKSESHDSRHFFGELIASTIGRSSLLLGGAIGAFIGTLGLYYISINSGIRVDPSMVLQFTSLGIIIGVLSDLAISAYVYFKKK